MTSFFTKTIIGSLVCFTSIAHTANSSASDTCPDGKKHYRVSARHIEGGGIGYNQGYTTLEAFIAADPGRWSVMPYLDARGHIFDNGKWAANAGAGLRTILGCRTYGLNAYYDYRNTHKLHYNQIGLGLETLGKLWDIRINGYLPVGKKITSPYNTQFDHFSGNRMILSQKHQFAMKGADAEVGFHFGKSRLFDFYAAAGPYYFIGEIGHNTWGGKGRLNGMFKDYITLEISDSYDTRFHNNFQVQLTLSLPFGRKSLVKKKGCLSTCKLADALNSRMLQPVGRQEIIVVGSGKKHPVAIDPSTGLPLFFIFVDNTSNSAGTYASPYPTLAQAQANSQPGDTIYVFPGDGTTTGMDSGISLKASQKFWGSGVSHSIQTTAGTISIPAQSSTSPTITNTNIDTEGNAINLASNNAISGFTIASAMNDAIYGSDAQNLQISSCVFQNTTTYPIEAYFSGDASISITSNQFLNNVNGIFLSLNGTSAVDCLDNTFTGQTSVSSTPLEILATNNTFAARIENNIFDNNTTGSIRLGLNNVVNAAIIALNNAMTNNGTGSQASLGSSFVVLPTGTTDRCSIALTGNTFSGNTSNALYLHTSGAFTTLNAAVSQNTMSNNGGSALVFATPVDIFTLVATNNTIVGVNDNGIAAISAGATSIGNITIKNNTITDIGNASNGIAINQDFSNLSLTVLNNEINRCEGTGIISYAPTGINSLTLNISGNVISNCQNLSSNAASGLDIEQYTNFSGSITNNTLSGNTGVSVHIGSGLTSPTACLTLTGNNSTDYLLINPVDGLFNLSPCNVDTVNVGTINTSGLITPVQSCSTLTPCPP
ncbi:MAG: right-handed parallel beta-helix repeat-containing protein [Chlamydiota bacterium]